MLAALPTAALAALALAAAALSPGCQQSSAATAGVQVPLRLLDGAQPDDALTESVGAGVRAAAAGHVKARWMYRRCVDAVRVIAVPAPRADAEATRARLLAHLRHESGLDGPQAGRVTGGRWSYAMHKGLTDSFDLERQRGAPLRLLVMPTWARREAAELDAFELDAVAARPDALLVFALAGRCRK